MKKFLTLMAAAAMTLSASAEVIYSWQSEGPDAVQQIGGVATAKVDEARVNYANKSGDITYYTICLCGKKQTYPESAYVNVTLDKPLAEGDVISVTAYRNKDAKEKNVTIEFLFDGNKDNSIASTEQFANINPAGEADPAPSTQTFTVPAAAAGCKFFDMTRGSAATNLFITKLEITREGSAAATFQWEPLIQNPSIYGDVTSMQSIESLLFQCFEEGVAPTEVMPLWQDEDGNEIKAVSGGQDDWNPTQFIYQFNTSDFKSNGEYVLVFPEGMLVNAAGEKSAKLEMPYTFDIPELAPAMFDDFEILSMTPDLKEAQAIWQDQMVTINTNHNDAIGLTKIVFTNKTTGEYVGEATNYTSYRELGDKSEITFEVVGPFTFFKDSTYEAVITFYNATDEYTEFGPAKVVDRVTYEFTGKVEPYKFSDVTLLSVDPYPGSIVISEPDQAVFTFLFSGPVNVYKVATPLGQNGNVVYPESCLSSNDDKTIWTLNISDQEYLKTVQTQLTLAIYAKDLDGSTVKGNEGVDAASHFEYNWECEVGAKPLVIVSPVAGSTIDSLKEVVVKSADGGAMTWSWNGEANIIDQYDMIIGTLVYEEPAEGEEAAATEFRFTRMVDEFFTTVPLTNLTEGYYTIKFDSGCFNFGEQFEDAKSRSVTSTFTIGGDTQANLKYKSTYPEVGTVVKTLDTIIINYGEPVTCDEFEVNVYSALEGAVTTGVGKMDNMEPTMVVITLKEPITAEGKYSVIVPAGVIINGDYYESKGEKGLCNAEFSLNYTVGEDSEEPGVDPSEQETFEYTSVDPADGATVAELSHIALIFPDVVMTMNDVAYVYKADAETEPIANATVNWDFDNEYLIKVDLVAPITDAGKYVVVIPARTIGDDPFAASEGKQGTCNPEIKLTYTIGGGSAVDAVEAADADAVYYDLTGRRVQNPDKGIYIVNGKKVVK